MLLKLVAEGCFSAIAASFNPEYKITSNGKLQLESKEDMKKRGVSSPDVADALALTLSRPTEGDNLGVIWL